MIRGLAMTAAICLWSLATWYGSGRFAAERAARQIERGSLETRIRARAISANIAQRLSQVRNIPMVIADEPSVATLLNRFGPDARPSPTGSAGSPRTSAWTRCSC